MEQWKTFPPKFLIILSLKTIEKIPEDKCNRYAANKFTPRV